MFKRTLLLSAAATTIALGVAGWSKTIAANEAGADFVDIAVAAGSFNALVAAVQAAGLVETLKGDGPVTVFAPTDQALAKLPEDTVEMLLKPKNKDKLAVILTYHVVAGKVMSGEIAGKRIAPKTVQGHPITVNATSGVMASLSLARAAARRGATKGRRAG